MRVNIDQSEGGTCNSQFSKSIQDVDLNTSAGICIGQGYNHVQLQGLTLCGSVTAGRQSLKIIKFHNIFDLHRSPVCRERIGLRAPYLLCVRYILVPTDPVNGFSKCIQDVDLNTSGGIRIGQGYNHVQLQGLTLCGSVTAGRQI